MEKNKLKKFIYIIKTTLLATILWFVTFAVFENTAVNRQINHFISRGVLCEVTTIPGVMHIYNVPRETSAELRSLEVNDVPPQPAFTGVINGNRNAFRPGSKGDILITLESPFADLNVPLVHQFVSFFVGGHASLVAMNWSDWQQRITEDQIIDTSGLHKDENDVVMVNEGLFWMDRNYRTHFTGLRVVSTKKQRTIAVNEAISFIGDSYNHSFVLNTYGRHYCTDKISKAYAAAGINLNHNGFATTVQNLAVSSNTYIFMHKRTDRFGIIHIYMLEDTFCSCPKEEESCHLT